jgi:hypothetical protein
MTLGLVLLLLLLGGILSFGIKKAPFIDEPWKTYMIYAVWVFIVIFIVGAMLGGWHQITDIRIGHGS